MIDFNGVLYNSTEQAHAACAEEWLSAGGMNSPDNILEILRLYADKDLADDCVKEWNIREKDWFDMDELIGAFKKTRAEAFRKAYGWD